MIEPEKYASKSMQAHLQSEKNSILDLKQTHEILEMIEEFV